MPAKKTRKTKKSAVAGFVWKVIYRYQSSEKLSKRDSVMVHTLSNDVQEVIDKVQNVAETRKSLYLGVDDPGTVVFEYISQRGHLN